MSLCRCGGCAKCLPYEDDGLGRGPWCGLYLYPYEPCPCTEAEQRWSSEDAREHFEELSGDGERDKRE